MLLHLLKPETAHRLTLWALKNNLGPKQRLDDPALNCRMFGKNMRNPIGLAAGAEKCAEALAGWSRMGFGMVEAGTVTMQPRQGNPQPRIWRLENDSMINWLGLPGEGVASFVANLREFHNRPERQRLLLGASLASPEGKLIEFRELALRCNPWVDYLTLNSSCPNVSRDKNKELAKTVQEQIKETVRGAQGKPVLLKLGPTMDASALKLMVDVAMDAGATGMVVTNTLPWDKRELLDSPIENWPQNEDQPVGGYSGPDLLKVSTFMVTECRSILGKEVPIIGVGGVQSGEDARQLMDAGANAIQLYTGMTYKGAGLLKEIGRELIR